MHVLFTEFEPIIGIALMQALIRPKEMIASFISWWHSQAALAVGAAGTAALYFTSNHRSQPEIEIGVREIHP